MNSIPAPLNGDFDFGDTLTDVDENGDLFYYATTSDVYIYWRVISKEGFEIHLATKSALVNIEDPADVVPWTIKVNSIWGDVEQGDISTDFRNGYEVTGESNKPIYKFDGQTTTNWGCIRFDCTTDKVSKTGSYDSIISLVIEGK